MSVKRSAGVLCNSTALHGGMLQRQQKNDLTSFVDASNVYGSSDQLLTSLRNGTTPFLKVTQGRDGPRLPDGDDSNAVPTHPTGFIVVLPVINVSMEFRH
ncbi:hypothetical protein DPMN_124163 [Dreissena polymorpha]|uniref:Uncharacterized protein n=1 Tax=Dreissena polymorpha TaxID=45954 RepID=A0A9D4GSQ1_DREPO|nr:hypothetical protein DPMN_124163 [Dreissena polymorpha]